MTRRAQGITVAVAVILAIALAFGGVVVLAGSGQSGRTAASGRAVEGIGGPNRLIGTNRRDVIDGRGGADVIRVRGGGDVLRGGEGGDEIAGGRKFDRMFGGSGQDAIDARDRQSDEVDCGGGRDVAIVDRHEDGVYDCERLKIPAPSQGRSSP